MDRKKNSVTMVGKKLSTLPTPAQMPSTTRPWTTGLMSQAVRPASIRSVTQPTPSSIRSDRVPPMTVKVKTNTRAMIPKKQGMAVNLPVSTRSMDMLRLCSLLSWGRTTVFLHRVSRKRKRILAMAASRSRPVSCSMTDTICRKACCFSGFKGTIFSIRASCSTSLVVANRTGSPARRMSASKRVPAA